MLMNLFNLALKITLTNSQFDPLLEYASKVRPLHHSLNPKYKKLKFLNQL